MAEFSNQIVEEKRELNQNDEAFEHAYFTNSYPQESSKTKCVTNVIKVMTFIIIFVEVATGVGIAGALA